MAIAHSRRQGSMGKANSFSGTGATDQGSTSQSKEQCCYSSRQAVTAARVGWKASCELVVQ